MRGILKDFEKSKTIERRKDRIRSIYKKEDKIYLLETAAVNTGSLSNLYTIFWDWDGTMICKTYEGPVIDSKNCITLISEHDRAFFFLSEEEGKQNIQQLNTI